MLSSPPSVFTKDIGHMRIFVATALGRMIMGATIQQPNSATN
jgi:hypothetical protein